MAQNPEGGAPRCHRDNAEQHRAEAALLTGLTMYGANEEDFRAAHLALIALSGGSSFKLQYQHKHAISTLAVAAAIEVANANIDTRRGDFG